MVLDPAPKPKRRTYTAEYRARVLAEYEAAPLGVKSAVLRREGLYQTLVAEWAKTRDAAAAGRTYRRDRKPRFQLHRPRYRGRWGCPSAVNASARLRVDFAVQRSADIGSPRVAGSTGTSSAAAKPGSATVAALRPPPGRRDRPAASSEAASNSATPRVTVDCACHRGLRHPTMHGPTHEPRYPTTTGAAAPREPATNP